MIHVNGATKIPGVILAGASLVGCGSSNRTYHYSEITGTNTPAGVVAVKVWVTKGLKAPELPGSFTTPFVIQTKIVDGKIPGSPKVDSVELEFYHMTGRMC